MSGSAPTPSHIHFQHHPPLIALHRAQQHRDVHARKALQEQRQGCNEAQVACHWHTAWVCSARCCHVIRLKAARVIQLQCRQGGEGGSDGEVKGTLEKAASNGEKPASSSCMGLRLAVAWSAVGVLRMQCAVLVQGAEQVRHSLCTQLTLLCCTTLHQQRPKHPHTAHLASHDCCARLLERVVVEDTWPLAVLLQQVGHVKVVCGVVVPITRRTRLPAV